MTMGTYDTKGGSPVSPPEQGREPTPFEDEVLGALEDMERAASEVTECQKILGAAFLRMLGWREGTEVDTRDSKSPAFLAHVMRGRSNGTHRFRVIGVSADVFIHHPSLSKWDAKVIPLRESDGKPFPKADEVILRGRFFRNADISELSAHDFILKEVENFERAEWGRERSHA